MLESNMVLKPTWTNNIGLCNFEKNNVHNTMWICINILVNHAELFGNKHYMETSCWNEQCWNFCDKLCHMDLQHVYSNWICLKGNMPCMERQLRIQVVKHNTVIHFDRVERLAGGLRSSSFLELRLFFSK